MKITYKLVFTLLSFFIFSIAFSQDISDKEMKFDVVKLISVLKKHGVADKDLQQEIAAFRLRQQKVYEKYQNTKKYASKKQGKQKSEAVVNRNSTLKALSTNSACVIEPSDRGGYIQTPSGGVKVNAPSFFELSYTNSSSEVYTYIWSVFNSQNSLITTGTDASFTFSFPTLEEYKVQLEITDQNGCITTYIENITPLDECTYTENDRAFGIMAPGDYSNYTTLLNINQTYDLTATFWSRQGDYQNLTYNWSFYNPDGTLEATGTNPVFPITLAVPGYHKVVLSVTDNINGCTTTNFKIIGSLISNSCTEQNSKSDTIKNLLTNLTKKLIARSLMGETDVQINNNQNQDDFNSLKPYLKNSIGNKLYNYTTVYHAFNEGSIADVKFSFSPESQYDVHFAFRYGIYPFYPEYETVEQLYQRVEYALYINTSQYISFDEYLNSCYVTIGGRMSNTSAPVFSPDDCYTKSEIRYVDFCPSNCGDPITGIIKIIKTNSYSFQFSNPKNTSLLACDEVAFPVKLYTSTQTLSIGSQLYLNQSLTLAVTTENVWYQNQNNATSYKIDPSGKIIEIYSCSPSTCSKRFLDSVVVVVPQGQTVTLNYFLPNGTEINLQHIAVGGGDELKTFIVQQCIAENSITIDGNPTSTNIVWTDTTNCCPATPITRTYSYKAIHPLGHSGTDFVEYENANGNIVTKTFPRSANANENECQEIVAKRIISDVGVVPCAEE